MTRFGRHSLQWAVLVLLPMLGSACNGGSASLDYSDPEMS